MAKAREDVVIPGAVARVDISMPGASSGGAGVCAPVDTNLDENPSFEVNLNGVTTTNCTIERSGTKVEYGSYSCRAEATGIPVILFKKRGVDYFSIVAGRAYVHSVLAQLETGDTGMAQIAIQWYDAGENLVYTHNSSLYSLSDSAWEVMQVVGTAPANAVYAQLYCLAILSSGEAIYLDGQEFRCAPSYVGPYIDGDQESCLWEGTVHQSVSIREAALSRPPVGLGVGAEPIPLARAKRQRE